MTPDEAKQWLLEQAEKRVWYSVVKRVGGACITRWTPASYGGWHSRFWLINSLEEWTR